MAAPALLREPRLPAAPRGASLAPAAPRIAERTLLVEKALAAFASHGESITNRDTIGMVDFAAHSGEHRFALIDPANGRVRASYLVAHGQGSDPGHTGFLESFSNVEGSNATSRGAFLVAEPYVGKYGRSRRLVGLEPDNDLARQSPS